MKPTPIFFVLALYILAAFSWLTYSSIRNSKQMHEDEIQLIYANAYKVNADIINQISQSVVQDSTQVKEYVARNHPMYVAVYVPQSESFEEYALAPKDEVIQAVDDKLERRIKMYVSEGAVFVLLLLWGLVWIYRSFAQRIELNKQQQNFLLSVTHELKTPLAAVKLYLQTLQKRELDKEQKEKMLHNAVSETDRLNDLVENVLVAAQIDGKSYRFTKENINLSQLVEEISKKLGNVFANKAALKLSVEQDIFIDADRFTLTLAISNLIENAFKYARPDGAEVRVNLRKEMNKPLLTVEDNGSGISLAEQSKVFNKFYRVGNESTRKTKGTGLGLFIVKQVLDKHQAQIQLKSNLNEGTIFTVKF